MPALIQTMNIWKQYANSMFLGFGVFLLCMFSLLTHPHFDLSTLWLGNAFMLGMLIRFPHLAVKETWVFCTIAFVVSDFLIGTPLYDTVVLNIGNLVSVAAGYYFLASLPRQDQTLQRPLSILYFFRSIIVASLAAGVMGAIINPILFGSPPLRGFVFWAVAEIINYTALLPMLLTMPKLRKPDGDMIRRWLEAAGFHRMMPLTAFIVSALAGALVGGPGAIAFPVPALLWCALSYKLFTTCFLSFVFAIWTLMTIRTGFLFLGVSLEESRHLLISTRLGVTLIALAPLVVASVMAAQDELLEKLRFLADRDEMTGLRNRRAFFEDGSANLSDIIKAQKSAAVMMLDIDHFKAINDNHGHGAGDKILIEFSRILEDNVRHNDVIGRIGGEEFAILLTECDEDEATTIADRIINVLRSSSFDLDNGRSVPVTVSIGVYIDRSNADARSESLDHWLNHADKALYRAKHSGRDRFEIQI